MLSRSRLLPVLVATAVVALPGAAIAHELFFDHPFAPSGSDATPPSPAFQAGGPNAKWEAMGTIPTGNPHTDLDFFTHKGETFAAVGTLAIGPNGGGQTIVKLLDKDGKPAPAFVTGHPSATCISNPSAALGLQHDVEATPKAAGVPLNTANSKAKLGDAQLLVDATDAEGRCHDQGFGGLPSPGGPAPAPPQGGLEIIDITEGPDKAVEIGLTSHIGESHTVNIDPKRPHIAYSVTSDSVSVTDGKRANDTSGTNLDGWEVVDLSSCMNFPAGTTVEKKRAACRPQVYRYRYPSAAFAQGHTADDDGGSKGVYGCHELEVYADDRLTCAAGGVSLLFDMSGAFDDNGTPADYSDDKPKGTPLPCAVRPTSTVIPAFTTGAMVTDCHKGTANGAEVDLGVPNWTKIGAPSLEGVKHLGTAQHMGRGAGGNQPTFDSTQDIDFSHETELTHSGRYMFSSDERGGGVTPPGAACDTPDQIKVGNGGLHFYAVDRLRTSFTGKPEEAFASYAKKPDGSKAIYRAPIRTGAQATICTAHVFQQIPGQNRIFMGWYSQGTQVIDYVERPDGTLELKEAGYFIPAGANQWVSSIYKVEKNTDGTFTYYGAAGDFNLGEGRSAIDLYKVTLPAPPSPRIDAAEVAPAAVGPANIPAAPTSGSGATACVASSSLRNVAATPRGRGLRVSFAGTGGKAVDVEIFQVARADRVLTAKKRVARFRGRTKAFTWSGRGAGTGVYVVRYRLRDGKGRVQRVAVRRKGTRFSRLGSIERRAKCDEIGRLSLVRPAFGGRTAVPLGVLARASKPGTISVTLRRGGKIVRRSGVKALTAGNLRRVNIRSKGLARGTYQVRIEMRFEGTLETVTLGATRL